MKPPAAIRPVGRDAIRWLAAALVAMPLLQLVPIDYDRSGALVLLLPTLWAGRKELAAGVGEALGCRWGAALFALGALGTLVSISVAEQPTPAAVTGAEWVILAAAAVIVGRTVREDPAASRWLLGGIALGVAAGTVFTWLWWIAAGRGLMPLYAHHRHLGLHALAGAMASTILLVPSPARRAARWLWLGIGVICWAGLLWSGGRGPVLALAVALAGWLVVAPAMRKPLITAAVLQAAAGLALSACFWTSRPELGWWHAFERTVVAAEHEDVSALTSTRSEGWRTTLARAAQRPWTGHGPDGYRFTYPRLDGEQAHNVALQLWLDLGFVTGSALGLLLAAVVVIAWRQAARHAATPPAIGWTALATAMLIEGGLDGVFYHLLAFLPTMVALGAVWFGTHQPGARRVRAAMLAPIATMAAVLVLGLHSVVFYLLAVAPPPRTPDGLAPKLLRAFPSTTYGLWRWTDAWTRDYPDAALAWDRWGESHAANAPLFHVRVADRLLARGDRQGAIAEFRAAEAKAHWSMRPVIAKMRLQAENAAP